MIDSISKPKKGDIVLCSLGCIGLITTDEPIAVIYPDGNKAFAFVGIHLTDKVAPIGSKWSSRFPKIIGNINDLEKEYLCQSQ
jgi:hypothetical protein